MNTIICLDTIGSVSYLGCYSLDPNQFKVKGMNMIIQCQSKDQTGVSYIVGPPPVGIHDDVAGLLLAVARSLAVLDGDGQRLLLLLVPDVLGQDSLGQSQSDEYERVHLVAMKLYRTSS